MDAGVRLRSSPGPATYCEPLGKLLCFSVTQFSYLQNGGDDKSMYTVEEL